LKLTPETGLINIARLEQDETAKSIKKGTAGTNYSIKTLLFPQMIPGAIIYVESSLTKGNMIIQSIKMTGSNFDGDFKVEAEVKAV
jgi:hypothetical protein